MGQWQSEQQRTALTMPRSVCYECDENNSCQCIPNYMIYGEAVNDLDIIKLNSLEIKGLIFSLPKHESIVIEKNDMVAKNQH